jgi:superfamily II DNA or RNA helicase
MSNWRLTIEPRRWQAAALEAWRAGHRGVVEVVTGAGKTAFALMCLQEFFKRDNAARSLILVPTIALLDQWFLALQEDLGVSQEDIGLLSGEEKPRLSEPIIVAVINSARTFTASFSKARSVFLVVDECHRAGSPMNARALEGSFVATLGLSATPERDYDAGFHDIISPRLGPIIYQYGYRDAARDGVISPFLLINVEVDMLAREQQHYDRLSRAVARCMRSRSDGEDNEERLKRLLQQRAAVYSNAVMRIPVAVKLVEGHRGERAIVFHERIEAATKIKDLLIERGHRATIYHAGIGPNIRRDNLRLFRKGVFDVLVCCRALDEGMDVPEASVAVIASSTASHRQRIQRLGRILRRAKNKEAATVYTLFATNEEQRRLLSEENELEGVTSVMWRRGRVQSRA